MSPAPLISVVTVTLNCREAALQTARSVLEQEFGDYEYLVKDGGSTDGTAAALQDLGVGVETSPDGGVYPAMMQAAGLCRGDYLCYLNAGDVFCSPAILGEAAAALRQGGWPDLLYGDVRTFGEHPVLKEAYRDIRYPNRLGRFYLFRKMICHQAWFTRRALVLRLSFDPRYPLVADYAFLLRAVLVEKVRYRRLPVITVAYRGGGLTERQPDRLQQEHGRARADVYSPLEIRLYSFLFDTLWSGLRSLAYRLYPLLPGRVKGRLHGL